MSTSGENDFLRSESGDDPLLVVPVEAPLTVVPVGPPSRPPHPGFAMSVVWAIAFMIVSQGAVLVASVALVGMGAIWSGEPDAYLKKAIEQKPGKAAALSAEGVRLISPGLLFGQTVGILFAWLIVWLIVGRRWQQELAFRLPAPLHLGLLLLGLPAFLILPEVVMILAKKYLPSIDYQDQINELIKNMHWVYGILIVGFGAGIGEELWCRGFLGRGLLARYGVVGGILLTSLLFGLMHIDPPHVVGTLCMGAILHFVYLMTRSLIAPMIVHTLNNGFGVLMVHLTAHYPEADIYLTNMDRYSVAGKLPLYLSSAILLAVVGWALYRSRKEVVAEFDGVSFPWHAPYPGVADPPEGSGAFLVRLPLPGAILGAVLAAVLLFVGTYWWTGQQAQKNAPAASHQAAVGK